MTIIDAIRTHLETYTGLEEDAPIWVDNLGAVPTEYSIEPLPGDKVLETYIDSSSLRSFPFAFNSMESTAGDPARLENIGFFETFAEWLEAQTEAGTLPTLGTGKTAISIEALGWGWMLEQGESGTGIYQIQCRLIYEQE